MSPLPRFPRRPRPVARTPVPARPLRGGVELLTDRVVPTVGALGLLDGDFLTVVGDDTDNTIVVRQSGGRLTIDGGRFSTTAGLADSIDARFVNTILVLAGDGDDTVLIDPSVTIGAVIEGGDGDDLLVAGGGATLLFGGAGDDVLFGGRGDDRLYGEDGDDELYGRGGRDVAFGGLGADVIGRSVERRGDDGAADITALVEPPRPPLPAETPPATPALGAFRVPAEKSATLVGDVLFIQGSFADDTIQLVLTGGQYSFADGMTIRTDDGEAAGVDVDRVRLFTVLGYSGNDVIDLSPAQVPARIGAGAGDDVVVGGFAGDFLFGQSGNDVLVGGNGADQVYGGSGDDFLDLGRGADLAFGGPGADTIIGGRGRDRLADADAIDLIGDDVEEF